MCVLHVGLFLVMICARLIVLQRQMAWSLALGHRRCILGNLLQDGVILFVSAVGQKHPKTVASCRFARTNRRHQMGSSRHDFVDVVLLAREWARESCIYALSVRYGPPKGGVDGQTKMALKTCQERRWVFAEKTLQQREFWYSFSRCWDFSVRTREHSGVIGCYWIYVTSACHSPFSCADMFIIHILDNSKACRYLSRILTPIMIWLCNQAVRQICRISTDCWEGVATHLFA